MYYDLPSWLRFWKRGQRGVRLYYYLWQIGAYFLGKKLHKEVRFDIIHHVTFCNYWMPSLLALLPAPFLWGPVGGGVSSPREFLRSFSLRGKIYESMRDTARWVGEHDPFVRLAARRAQLALATTPETKERLEWLGCRQVGVMIESGMDEDELRSLRSMPFRKAAPFRLMSIGRLLHWKGFHLSLEAFALFLSQFPDSEYWLIGDGPERRHLKDLAFRLGIGEKVLFWGALSRELVLRKLDECDVLVHPSLHESGGWVCLEAMAAGRPIICFDIGGPAVQVTENVGIKVPVATPEQAVNDLAKGMRYIAGDVERRIIKGTAARSHVKEHFSWEKKGRLLNDIYAQVVKQR
jgi:glycosyltransferase involved in cell wall biosynthesis